MKKYIKANQFDDFGHSTDPNDNKTNYKYYLPDLDIDGTVEEIYADVLHNYVTDRDALVAIQEILLQNRWNDEAKIVGYFIDEIDEEQEYGNDYNVSRMKIDIAEGYRNLEDIYTFGENKYDINIEIQVDGDNLFVIVDDNRDPNNLMRGSSNLPISEFMQMSRKDFDSFINEILFYGMYPDPDVE